MKFEDLLKEYEQQLVYVDRMTNPDTLSFYHKTKEYWDGYLNGCFHWFEKMKLECDDFKPGINQDFSKEEEDKYKYNIKNNDEEDTEYPLYGLLEYREEKIPVYIDENGQQLFIVYQEQEISGGSFNIHCEEDFCYAIDQIKDLKKEA